MFTSSSCPVARGPSPLRRRWMVELANFCELRGEFAPPTRTLGSSWYWNPSPLLRWAMRVISFLSASYSASDSAWSAASRGAPRAILDQTRSVGCPFTIVQSDGISRPRGRPARGRRSTTRTRRSRCGSPSRALSCRALPHASRRPSRELLGAIQRRDGRRGRCSAVGTGPQRGERRNPDC